MKKPWTYYLAGLILSLIVALFAAAAVTLSACTTPRPAPHPLPAAGIAANEAAHALARALLPSDSVGATSMLPPLPRGGGSGDSLSQNAPTPDSATPLKSRSTKPGLIARIFHPAGQKQDEKNASNPRGFLNPIPRKCKGCQIFYGPATLTTVAKKASAATAPGASAATVLRPGGSVAAGSDSAQLNDQSGAGVASSIRGDGNAPVLTNVQPKPPDGLLAAVLRSVGVGAAVLLVAVGLWWGLGWRERRKEAGNKG